MDEKTNVKFSIYVGNQFVTVDNIKNWFEGMLFFQPTEMRGKFLAKGTVKYDSKKLFNSIEGILRENSNFNIRVSNDSNSFSFWKHESNSSIICTVNGSIYSEIKNVLLEKINVFFMAYGGIVAFVCSSEDDFWQNLTDLDYYKIHGRSTEGVHTTKREISNDTLVVDVEYNPGHSHFVNDLWFGSCCLMWFGEEYFRYVPKEVLKSYKDCYKNKELENGSIRIFLYDNIFDYDKPENRERQWVFRRRVGIDEIAHQLMNTPYSMENVNPSIELDTGNFEHGGIKRIKYYLNKDGGVVPKSRAVEYKLYELDNDGKLIWSETHTVRFPIGG